MTPAPIFRTRTPEQAREFARTSRAHWGLTEGLRFLNHGSFGATPTPVLEAQSALRAELEASPVRFMYRELEERFDVARDRLATLVGADPAGLVFVPNATTGINTALAALTGASHGPDDGPGFVGPGDEILMLDPEYNATANAVHEAARRVGATVRSVTLPFPIRGPEVVLETLLAALDGTRAKTRLLVIDHIVSQTGLVLPIESVVAAMQKCGIETLIDGAHGPGQVPLALDALGAAFYTGNCHKWLCTPKGSALLHVRADWRERTRPLVISHGANTPRTDRSRLHIEFDWPGTLDPTPWLVIPTAIDFLESLVPGGLPALQMSNRQLVLSGRDLLLRALGIDAPAPASMIASLASVPLPKETRATMPPLDLAPLHVWLFEEHNIEVPVFPFRVWPGQMLRISAQAYNSIEEYEALAAALEEWFRGA